MTNQTFNWEIHQDITTAVQYIHNNHHLQSVSKDFFADDGAVVSVEIFALQGKTEIIMSCENEHIFLDDFTQASMVLTQALNTLPEQLDMFNYGVA